MAFASAARPQPLRAVHRLPPRLWLGRLSYRASRPLEARAVGSGADGHPRIGPGPPAGPGWPRPSPRRSARRSHGAVGDGGGRKMRRPLGRDRRAVGRPGGARLYRHPAARGRLGAQPSAVLAGTDCRGREPQRRTHALAARKRAVARPPVRPARAGPAGLERRAVPGTRRSARKMDRRA